jgi:3-oxoacyl-[acyl-carrier-protein] synthase-3
MPNVIITGTGSYIPNLKIPNEHFMHHQFFNTDGTKISKSNIDIIKKLQDITCIKNRRYLEKKLNTSDIAYLAARDALEGVDKEGLDSIIVAHNFGDVRADNRRSDLVPTIAARVKHQLEIENPYSVAFDIPFGCPGWLQGMIIGNYYIKSGDAKKILVIGAETLSRVSDPHDIDSMIYSDGAGATLVESTDEENVGILSHVTRSDTLKHAYLLKLEKSYNPDYGGNDLFMKMRGHEIYKYAIKLVPEVVKESLEKAGLNLTDVKKILIHQANEKMDEAILKRLFKLYEINTIPEDVMPMTISWLGNSSVATLPTLLDFLKRGQLENHRLDHGDNIVFASVGAGMNINAMVYRMS